MPKKDYKDETRMVSHRGHAIMRYLKGITSHHAAALLELQKFAWQTKNLELAEKITDLLAEPQQVNEVLELWSDGDIDALIELIEATK